MPPSDPYTIEIALVFARADDRLVEQSAIVLEQLRDRPLQAGEIVDLRPQTT